MSQRVSTKVGMLHLLREHEAEFRRLGVKRIGLFGSFARGEQTPQSDVDLLVVFDPSEKTFDNFMSLAERLEYLLGRRVDLVKMESLSPHLGPHILEEVEYAGVSA